MPPILTLGNVLTWLVSLLPPYRQIIYVEGKNGSTSNEPAVAIRMYTTLKPTAIPTARINVNVLYTGGRNRTEIIKSMFHAQWLLYLPPGATVKLCRYPTQYILGFLQLPK